MILTPGQLLRALRRQFKPKRHLKNFLHHSPLLMMNRVIALSEHGRSVLLRLGVRPERIAVVPNAVDADWWADETVELPATVAEVEGPLVLYLGQLKYRKGFDLLAQALPAILQTCPTAHFIFAGHSPIHEAELTRLAAQAGATDRLILLHNVTEGEKAALFQRAAQDGLYVLPTRYEGFGIPLIEAMSLGCPVVTTNIPVIDEMIKDGQNGVLFGLEQVDELAKAVSQVLTNPGLRAGIIEGGYQTVQDYFTPIVLDQLENSLPGGSMSDPFERVRQSTRRVVEQARLVSWDLERLQAVTDAYDPTQIRAAHTFDSAYHWQGGVRLNLTTFS